MNGESGVWGCEDEDWRRKEDNSMALAARRPVRQIPADLLSASLNVSIDECALHYHMHGSYLDCHPS